MASSSQRVKPEISEPPAREADGALVADLDPHGVGGGDDVAVLVEEGAGGPVGAGAGADGPADRDQWLADGDGAGAVRGERAEQGDPAAREHRGGVADAVQRAPH